MFPARFAVIADIHGNRAALDAVLADALAHQVEGFVDLGDVTYGPLDPAGTVARLMGLSLPLLRVVGNEDRVLWQAAGADPDHPSLEYTRSQLDAHQLAWLRGAPAEAFCGGLRLFHGRPGSDTTYLMEVVERAGLRPASTTELERALPARGERLVLCGHSHLQRLCRLPDGRQVLNPGSVGLQAYRDDQPLAHLVQSGSPHARYALVDRSAGEALVTLRRVAYDWEAAAVTAARNGRADWAPALRHGQVA